MKLCKDCKQPRGHENPLISRCKECQYSKQSLKRTEIKKIWKKRINRIKEEWSEYKVFIEIWKEREHICDNCWGYIKSFDPSCFAHILNKRDNPELRYKKENIWLVHGIWEQIDETGKTYNCHKEFDLKVKSK